MTNMSYLILTPSLTLKDIFTEKIYGTDKFLVVMVTQRQTHFLQWLKWLIYIAAFKDHCNVDHVAFCNKADSSRKPAMEGASLRRARCPARQFQAIQELLSSGGPALGVVDGGQNFFANIDDFVDRVVTATMRHPRARGAAPGDDAPH